MAYLTRRSARRVLRASLGAAWGAGRVNSPRVIGGRDHEGRDALASGTATSRGYLGTTGLGGGRRARVARERREVRDRAFIAIQDQTHGNCNCCRNEALLSR